MSGHEIDTLVKDTLNKLSKENTTFEKTLQLNLQRLVQKVQLDIVNTKKRADGYCINFVTPEKEVLNLWNDLAPGMGDQISLAFKHDWAVPSSAI
jgi:hypothetical protein